MPRLPVHDLSDVQLADAFDSPGCPICRRVTVSVDRFVATILDENVNDVTFRTELDEQRGFCAAHTRELLAANQSRTGGVLSAAILFAAVLRVRRRELAEVSVARGRGRARRAWDATRSPDCGVCARAETAVVNAVSSLGRLVADPAWAEALAGAPFCVDHLGRVLAASDGRGPWEAIERAQVERLGCLVERLDGFAHHSSHDRRHLLTDDERASVDEAARTLGGSG